MFGMDGSDFLATFLPSEPAHRPLRLGWGQARAPLKPSQARDDAAKISVRLDPSARAGFYLRSSDLRSEMPKPLARRSRMMEHIAD